MNLKLGNVKIEARGTAGKRGGSTVALALTAVATGTKKEN